MQQPAEPWPESTLIAQARHDPDAFRTLYQQYVARVYAYVAYRVGLAADAEDIVSDAFLKALEDLAHFEDRGTGSFAAWLFRIAHNLVQDFHRRQQRSALPVRLEAVPELRATALLPEEVVVQQESFAHLHHLIATLSPRRQEVITLKFFGGLRNRDIAEILELDERAVASHLCRGLADLHQKYLQDTGEMKKGTTDERTR